MKQTKAVALSGGVDSMMAANFLKEQGHHVIGIHFITGFETESSYRQITPDDPRHPVQDIGKQLGITVHIIDIRSEFQEKVVDYFTRTYLAGQTPNPCMTCNPNIKFGTIWSFARRLGAKHLATGHYARITKDRYGHFHLLKGIDLVKDQSYFLARLNQQQLAGACFPLGGLRKSEVKHIAMLKKFHPVTKGESQDVCFIKSNSYGQFLADQVGFEPKGGLIEDIAGNVIGKHKGLHLFTIGQRRGINCPASEPYYVIRLDSERNCLIVGPKQALLSSECKVVDINWICEEPTSPLYVNTRVRYRSKEVPSRVYPQNNHTAVVRFKSPQAAITPGQAAVFYRGEEILGGGWITKAPTGSTQSTQYADI
jgi:tRNA-specific 2-thiouridylase